jgi:hypothetical protein
VNVLKVAPCSEYTGEKVCRSGWPSVNGVCFGNVYVGCTSCGEGTSRPPCMQEDPNPNFIRADGKPLFWKDTTP